MHVLHESVVFCITCTMSSQRKFTFAISSPDEFLVILSYLSISWIVSKELVPSNVLANRRPYCFFSKCFMRRMLDGFMHTIFVVTNH